MRSRKNSNATVTYDVLYIETTTFDSRVSPHLLPFDFIRYRLNVRINMQKQSGTQFKSFVLLTEPIDSPSQETGWCETKHLIGMALFDPSQSFLIKPYWYSSGRKNVFFLCWSCNRDVELKIRAGKVVRKGVKCVSFSRLPVCLLWPFFTQALKNKIFDLVELFQVVNKSILATGKTKVSDLTKLEDNIKAKLLKRRCNYKTEVKTTVEFPNRAFTRTPSSKDLEQGDGWRMCLNCWLDRQEAIYHLSFHPKEN